MSNAMYQAQMDNKYFADKEAQRQALKSGKAAKADNSDADVDPADQLDKGHAQTANQAKKKQPPNFFDHEELNAE